MTKDNRYNLIKPMIDQGHIKSFEDVFKFIPKTVVANDLGMHSSRFTELIQKVDNFRIKDLVLLARLCNVNPRELAELVFKQYESNKSRSEK